ncbi:hypothetical protein APHAL10511_001592 [Amanita phalloides]|nr:hypothetical protein APHAL10511_001592 [Amanita phalloides]
MRSPRNRARDGILVPVYSLSRNLSPPLHRYPIPPPGFGGRAIPRHCIFNKMAFTRHCQHDAAIFPPLPAIHSPGISQQIFTHRSFYGRPTHVFEDRPGDLSPDNERFEYLGDTILALVVTTLIMDMYPGLHVGPLTKIRAMIVGNTTLAEISRRYKLHDRLLLHSAQAVTLRASFNIQADVFEAFVGGLYKDQGEDVVRDWLNPLFRPYAAEAYNLVRKQYGLPALQLPTPTSSPPPSCWPSTDSGDVSDDTPPTPSSMSPLAIFNQHINKTNRHVEWAYSDDTLNGLAEALAASALGDRKSVERGANGREAEGRNGNRKSALEVLMVRGSKSTPMWLAKVMVDGECVGSGRGNTKKMARNEAAKQGLQKIGIALDR